MSLGGKNYFNSWFILKKVWIILKKLGFILEKVWFILTEVWIILKYEWYSYFLSLNDETFKKFLNHMIWIITQMFELKL
jgi:hypothetical protein